MSSFLPTLRLLYETCPFCFSSELQYINTSSAKHLTKTSNVYMSLVICYTAPHSESVFNKTGCSCVPAARSSSWQPARTDLKASKRAGTPRHGVAVMLEALFFQTVLLIKATENKRKVLKIFHILYKANGSLLRWLISILCCSATINLATCPLPIHAYILFLRNDFFVHI